VAVTIADIARLAGVSKTTVSLIINEKAAATRISRETEERVRRIVVERGFQPSRYARGLRVRRSHTIGFVAPDFVNPFFARLNHDLEAVARRQGCRLLLGCSEDDPVLEGSVATALVSHQVDGLIVASVLDDSRLRKAGAERAVPTVFIDREIAHGTAASVASENEAGAAAAVSELCRRGARRIAFLGGIPSLSTSRERLLGYHRALTAHGLPYDSAIVLHGDYSAESGTQMLERLARARAGFDALFTSAYTVLEGVLAQLKRRHGTIPPEPMLATFDDHPLLDYLPVPIISVRQDTEALAKAAFDLIERALKGTPAVEHRRVPVELIPRV
jgi:LacI family sucrose operon transcriptional repressor